MDIQLKDPYFVGSNIREIWHKLIYAKHKLASINIFRREPDPRFIVVLNALNEAQYRMWKVDPF